MDNNFPTARDFLDAIWRELGGGAELGANVEFAGAGELPSVFAVTDFASAAVGAAAAAIAELVATRFGELPRTVIDRRVASLWFGWSIKPQGWSLPDPWDPIAGDYAAADGWIRLHTNAAHHREAALAVLGVEANREVVAKAVTKWSAEALETAVVEKGGCAAAMRSVEAWRQHPQGRSVNAEPLLAMRDTAGNGASWSPTCHRPLQGLRVLDLTRILAGPVATRFLAGFGADVLRIDPPGWNEPVLEPEVTLGKRCARLDLRDPAGKARLHELLRGAHVMVHGYRADALEKLGLDAPTRQRIRPGLIDVSLNAYGWTGDWRNRRGFDSLVQMSAGIADAGMRRLGKEKPTPLPVQALDHAAGYLMAAAVVRSLTRQQSTGSGCEARASLARTAALLIDGPPGHSTAPFAAAGEVEWSEAIEQSSFGPMRRLRAPVQIENTPMRWDRPATPLGTSPASW